MSGLSIGGAYDLKHDWIFEITQPTREHMRHDVAAYMRYYNLVRLHSANGDQSPINYEKSLKKVSGLSWPVHNIMD
jgi:putative transposase